MSRHVGACNGCRRVAILPVFVLRAQPGKWPVTRLRLCRWCAVPWTRPKADRYAGVREVLALLFLIGAATVAGAWLVSVL